MLTKIEGTVWRFGDYIDTDIICAGRYINAPLDEMKKHVLESIRPDFAAKVKPGDIIVGGCWFGTGSARETAPAALKALEIGAVIAESAARNFYRNAIGVGLPMITCSGCTEAFQEGDHIVVDFETMVITDINNGKKLAFEGFPKEMLQVLEAGGVENFLRQMNY